MPIIGTLNFFQFTRIFVVFFVVRSSCAAITNRFHSFQARTQCKRIVCYKEIQSSRDKAAKEFHARQDSNSVVSLKFPGSRRNFSVVSNKFLTEVSNVKGRDFKELSPPEMRTPT